MNKSIFITGIAGFIGSHVALALKKRGDHVFGCDNFNDYYSPMLKKQRADRLEKEGIEVIPLDICDIASIESRFTNVSHILHLAAQAGVRYSLENPQAYIHSNVQGFTEILELCKRNMPLRLIYASSSSVYGLTENDLSSESDNTNSPVSLYAATKKSGELLAHTYHHLYSIPMTGLRYFTVYGPWGRPDMAYFSFTESILAGKPIPVFNEGNLYRDFTYIDDIASGTIAAIDYETSFEVFNLGNETPVKLLRFIEILENSLGEKAILDLHPMQDGDVYKTGANLTKSKELLSFSPQTPLEIGIPQFTDWYLSTNELSSLPR